MWHREFIRVSIDPRRQGRCQAANPLWTLEELHGLRHPPFVADPEFTPFDIDALGADPQSVPALLANLRKFDLQNTGACILLEGNFRFLR
jgi:hypothetical protein